MLGGFMVGGGDCLPSLNLGEVVWAFIRLSHVQYIRFSFIYVSCLNWFACFFR